MRWERHVAYMEKIEVSIGFWWVNLKERHHFEDLDVDGRIILTLILKRMGGHGLDSSGLG
jgi:hypothetical protein